MKATDVAKWLFLFALILFGGWYGLQYMDGKHTEEVSAKVKSMITEDIEKDQMYGGVYVRDVSLIKDNNHEYSGLVEYVYQSDSQKVDVNVKTDDSHIMFQAHPPAELLMKRAQAQMTANLGG